ncbi:hypothetical protein ACTFIU_005920 [Dictyostelium citrinum]
MKSKRLFFLLCLFLVFISHYSVCFAQDSSGIEDRSHDSPLPNTSTPLPTNTSTPLPTNTSTTIPSTSSSGTTITNTTTGTSQSTTGTSQSTTGTSQSTTGTQTATTSSISTTTTATTTNSKPTTSDPTGPTHLGDEEDPYSDNSIFNGTIIVYVIGGACVVFVCIVLYKRFRTGRISTAQNNASYVALQMKD